MDTKDLLMELKTSLNSIRGSIKIDIMTGGSFEVADILIDEALELIDKNIEEVK